MTHRKEQPQSCFECGRAFIRLDRLMIHMRRKHKQVLHQMFQTVSSSNSTDSNTKSHPVVRNTFSKNDEEVEKSVKELLQVLVDETTLNLFGWSENPVHEVLSNVLRRCGKTPYAQESTNSHTEKMIIDSRALIDVVAQDENLKSLLRRLF